MIWKRLHPELHGNLTSTPGDEQSSLELKTAEYPSPPSELIQVSQKSSSDARIPRIQAEAEKKASVLHSDVNCPSQTCLIPKKRYCVQNRSETSTISADKYPELPPLTDTEYTETDMSAAMILATGFNSGRSKNDCPQIEEV